MKKNYKRVLVIINILIIGFAAVWFYDERGYEPIIVILGQAISLITIFYEGQSRGVNIQNVKNKGRVHTDAKTGDNVNVSDVDDSEVKTTIR